ncbi:uncharacterized protein LOC128965900 [Oppia nitens]|uniref:uncharacterized protein LOC128965900 n=1 Tax=Oppia nitens TaxID=1686743 RepID=UPI0023DBA7AA|nr:uncharacterized protein LOC128965900 [Oppia nitens]
MSEDDDHLMCAICIAIMRYPVTLPCGHHMCLDCFKKSIEMVNLLCPFCRSRISCWARKAKNDDNLIDWQKWNVIQAKYPHLVSLKVCCNQDIDTSENQLFEYRSVHRVISSQGEVHQEYEEFMKQESQRILKEEEETQRLIQTLLSEDQMFEEMRQKILIETANDEEIAMSLQQMDTSIVITVELYALFNSGGIRGNITFRQQTESDIVSIGIYLSNANNDGNNQLFEWLINELPVFYDSKNPCSASEVGKTEHDMTRRHGSISISHINNDIQTFTDSHITLYGVKSIWGKSVSLRNMNNSDHRTCSNVFTDGIVKSALATFTETIAGTVLFRENQRQETLIFTNLYNIEEEYKSNSRNEWKVLVSDILDTKRDRKCDYLQTLLDPNNANDSNCSTSNHQLCKIGDLTRKHGMAVIGSNNNRYSKKLSIDMNFPLSYLESSRGLYVTIYDKNSAKRVMSCAKLQPLETRQVKASISMDGVKGSILFSQSYRTDPTIVKINLTNLRGRAKWYHIHQFPLPSQLSKHDNVCSAQAVGPHFNPFAIDSNSGPLPAIGTNDMYEVGDLSGKYGPLNEDPNSDIYLAVFVDLNLPLFGINSIIGRSVVIHKGNGDRWICCNIGYHNEMVTAMATFVYPIVGYVIFRQLKDNPLSETTVFAELSYSDGTVNNTVGHSWHIHTNTHGRDFYNWSRRCDSAGPHFNPFNVGMGRTYNSLCNSDNQFRCEVGDLTSKSKKLSIASYKGSFNNKLFYTDTLLPLSGPSMQSIIGRSLVIHDDTAPQQRGDRLGCAVIRIVHPLTASARNWRTSTAIASNISGSIVFNQQTSYDATNGKVDLHGLYGLAHGYHIHDSWVSIEKEFPCAADAVYGHFNPLNVDVSVGPFPEVGSVDQYEVGDLSGKFGIIDNKNTQRQDWTDSSLSLSGPNSIIGRSIVIHKKEKNFRWVCSTINIEESKDMAREIVALASFHEPRHLISGYIRFKQLEYIDGSLSDTWIEVNLKYPGFNNLNVTSGHNWAVYVTPVGEDAFNQIDSVRCIASGYRWNPYLSKDDIDIYKKDCNPNNGLRCAMGDLSGKHNILSIGGQRKLFSDVNLPLIGNYSVMGRSVIIFKNYGHFIPLGCANIKPDIHLISNVAIKKTPTFTVNKFMSHMRSLLNATDWLIVADVYNTRDIADNQCVQLSVNFFGNEAHRFQVEFSNLINLGTVKRQTITGLKSVSTFYKPCKTNSK